MLCDNDSHLEWQCQRPWCSFRANKRQQVCLDCVTREASSATRFGVVCGYASAFSRLTERFCDKRGPIFTGSHCGKEVTIRFDPASIVVHDGYMGKDESYSPMECDMRSLLRLIGPADVVQACVQTVSASAVGVSSLSGCTSFSSAISNLRMRCTHDVHREQEEAAVTEVDTEEEEEETRVTKKRRREEEVVLPFVKIKLLKELKDDGAITDKEFEEKKRELLARV